MPQTSVRWSPPDGHHCFGPSRRAHCAGVIGPSIAPSCVASARGAEAELDHLLAQDGASVAARAAEEDDVNAETLRCGYLRTEVRRGAREIGALGNRAAVRGEVVGEDFGQTLAIRLVVGDDKRL